MAELLSWAQPLVRWSEMSSPSLCIWIVYFAWFIRGSFAISINFVLFSWMRRPRQHVQHISSLNCCS